MFYGETVQDTRQVFFLSWHKYQQNQPLLPLEKQVVEVIIAHPEYHALLEAAKNTSDKTYFPEMGQANPFLHMGLHLAVRDQIATDRPLGIKALSHQLLIKYGDLLTVEHLLIEHLAECLWQAQRDQSEPNVESYLAACQQLL